jgi:hypothetical protein
MAMMEKMTAVEWLYQRILANDIKAVYDKALEMEKEQIEKAFEEGMFHHTNGLCPNEYYKDTFKSE